MCVQVWTGGDSSIRCFTNLTCFARVGHSVSLLVVSGSQAADHAGRISSDNEEFHCTWVEILGSKAPLLPRHGRVEPYRRTFSEEGHP